MMAVRGSMRLRCDALSDMDAGALCPREADGGDEHTAKHAWQQFTAKVIEWKLIWPSMQDPGLLLLDTV